MKTTIWRVKCECGEYIHYYPKKLLLETNKDSEINMSKRIVSLTCCSGCKITKDYEFPIEFIKIL